MAIESINDRAERTIAIAEKGNDWLVALTAGALVEESKLYGEFASQLPVARLEEIRDEYFDNQDFFIEVLEQFVDTFHGTETYSIEGLGA